MNHSINVQLGANIDKYKAGMEAAKRTGTESLGFIAAIFDKIKSMFGGLWDGFKSMLSGAGDKIKSGFSSVSDSVSGAFKKIASYLPGFHSDLDKTKAKMGETEEKSSSLASKIVTGLVVAFAALAVATTVLVAKGLMVDAMYAGIATSTGVAASQISGFEAVASRSGMSLSELGTTMGKFREEMKKAAVGDGSDEFTKLGVKVTDANGALRDERDVLIEVSKRVAALSSEAEKYDAAAKVAFGGKAQFLEDTAHAGDLSVRVTNEQANAAARLGKIWHEILPGGKGAMTQAIDGISDKLTNSLTPAMTEASVTILESKNRIVDAFNQMFGGGDALDKLGVKIQEWSQKASGWFAGVAKSATDTAIGFMKTAAQKTGLGNADAFNPKPGYVPGPVSLTSDAKPPVVTDAERAAQKQFESTTKSMAERIAIMQMQVKVGDTLTEGQREQLKLDQAGQSLSADDRATRQKQIDSLVSLEKQFKSIQEAKAAGAAASKKEEEAYATLSASIQSKIDVNRLELAIGDDATESQKLQAKLTAEIASGKLKLSDAHLAAARAALVELGATEQQVKAAQAQREVDKYIAESVLARNQQNAALAVEYDLYGKSSDARAIAMVAVDAETWKEKELAKLRADKKPITDQIIAQLNAEAKARTEVGQATLSQTQALQYAAQLQEENRRFSIDYIADDKQRAAAQLALDADVWKERIRNAGDGTEAQRRLQENYDTWYRNQLLKPQLEEQKKVAASIESTMHDTFISIFDSGKSAFDRLRDALKNGLLELLYQMTLKKWVMSVSAVATTSAIASEPNPGDPMAVAGATTSGNSLMSAVSSASSLYKSVTGGLSTIGASMASSLGKGVASLGDTFGSSAVSSFGKGMQGFGQDGSLGSMAGYGQTAGKVAGAAGNVVSGYMMGSTLNSAISGQYQVGSGLKTVEKISTAVASYFSPVAGAVVGAVSGLINRAFGMGDKKVTASGVKGTLTADSLTGSNYSTWHQDGGWFRSDKNGTDTTALTDAMVKQFTQGLASIEAASSGFASSLGVSADWIKDYSKTFDIALTGDATKDAQAITDFFTGVGDEIAKRLVPNLDTFAKSGETASATLERLAGDFQATDQVAQLIGKSAAAAFGTVGIGSAAARERLVDLAGGASVLAQQAGTYAQNFLTDAQRLAPVQEALAAAMADLGLSSVQTRGQFKDVVDSLDLTTEAGAAQFTAMMKLAEAFAQVHPDTAMSAAAVLQERTDLQKQLDQLTMSSTELLAQQRAALDESNRALFDQVQVAQAAKTAIETHSTLLDLQAQIYALTGDKVAAATVLEQQHAIALAALDPALREATQNLWDLQASSKSIDSVKSAATTLLSNVDDAFSVLQRVTKVTTDALTTRITAEKALSDAVKSTLASMKAGATDLTDRASAQAQVKAALAIAKAGGPLPEASTLQKSFSVLSQDASSMFATRADYLRDFYSTQNDIAALGDLADSSLSVDQQQLDSLNSMLAAAQQQIDILKGIDTTGLTIAQALAGFQAAQAAGQANPYVGSVAGITSAYQQALGRAPDSAGLEYWKGQAAGGMPLSQIQSLISGSVEAQVQSLYQELLDRPADAGGLQFYVGSGASIDSIRDSIKQSDEYQALHGIPGFEAGGLHGGGLRIVGENGPELEATGASRIWNANQTATFLQGGGAGDSTAFAAAVDRLAATVERQQVALDQQADDIKQTRRDTRRLADTLDRVTRGGDKMVTTTEAK